MTDPIAFYGDDLVTQKEAAVLLGVVPATVRKYMKTQPPLRYARIGGLLFFSKLQIAQWIQLCQEQVDPMMSDVKRAQRPAQ